MMGKRIPFNSGDEHDALNKKYRHMYVRNVRPGVTSKIKRKYRQRERQVAKRTQGLAP